MTTSFLVDYIPRRMRELGFGDKYYTRMRHFILEPGSTLTLKAWNDYFLLVEETTEVRILSDFGVYDRELPNINELHYEHHGKILITNKKGFIVHVNFVQVIPIKE